MELRTFGNFVYRAAGLHPTKPAAQRAAASDRRAGFRVRIVSEGGKYRRWVSLQNFRASDAEMRRLMRHPFRE